MGVNSPKLIFYDMHNNTGMESPEEWKQDSFNTTQDERQFSHAKYGYFSVIFIFLGYQFAGQGLLFLFARSGSPLVTSFMQGLGQMVFMLLPAFVLMFYSPLKVPGLMRLRGSVTGGQWILGLFGILAIQLFASGYSHVQEYLIPDNLLPAYKRIADRIDLLYRELLGGATHWDAARALIVGAVIPALSEEVLFRGVLQRSLEQVRTPRRAILITAIIFGILHLNIVSLVPLICIGIFLGFMAYYTQSLALPIVAHFFNNACAIIVLYVPESVQFSFSPLLAMVAGMVGFIAVMAMMFRWTPQIMNNDNNE